MKPRQIPPLLLFPAVLCMLLVGCAKQQETASAALNEQAGACSQLDTAIPVFGTEEFHRANGKPVEETRQFQVPIAGDVCVLVTNGLHPPPHGHRVSSAWIRIDDKLVIGPDSFSQQVETIQASTAIAAGTHTLSVKLDSKPESFLTLSLMFLPSDDVAPAVEISPANGSLLSTDMPFFLVSYTDDISGVDLDSLALTLNGNDVTQHFQVDEDKATWQVTITNYLEEGLNELVVTLADNAGNTTSSAVQLTVQTPTEVLMQDLDSVDAAFRQRSAYKLLPRRAEFDFIVLRRCLKQLMETPEPKGVNGMLSILQSPDEEHISRALAAGATGEAARVDIDIRQREDVVFALGNAMLDDPSYVPKTAAARALGLTRNELAMTDLVYFMEFGPRYPPEPEGCDQDPAPDECLEWAGLVAIVGMQVTRAAIRIKGQGYFSGNPVNLMEAREKYLQDIQAFREELVTSGGAP